MFNAAGRDLHTVTLGTGLYAVLLTSQFTNAPGCRVRSVEQHRNRIEGAGGIQLRACGSIPLPQGPDRRKAEYAGFDPYYQ